MDRKLHINSIFTDIRFWILLFFLIRLTGITNPPLETGHNWRQSLTSMITRNFSETDNSLLYPRIDMAGDASGIIGSEFPAFNYLAYLANELFGFTHWYGRLINLLLSSFGIFCFYRLAEHLFSKRVAFPAAMVLLSSIWFAYSRKIMPDTFSISLMLIGSYWCYKYYIHGNIIHILIFLICITLGMLSKLPAMLWMVPVFVSMLSNTIPEQRRLVVLAAGSAALAITSTWYFYWVPHLVETYHYQLYFPKSLTEGWQEIGDYIPELLKNFYFHALSSYVAFGCFLAGIVLLFMRSHKLIRIASLGLFFVFAIFIIKTGSVFPLHNYYIIPFVPFMALTAGFALSAIKPLYGYILLTVISFEAILNQQHDFFIKDSEKYKMSLEAFTDSISNKNELIIINGGQSPQLIYFAHRKGWTFSNSEIEQKDAIGLLKHRGAKLLIIDKKNDFSPDGNYRIAAENGNFKAYRLTTD
jgi:hypothetical protein